MKVLSELGFKFFLTSLWNKIKARYDNKLAGIYSATTEQTEFYGTVKAHTGKFNEIDLPSGTFTTVDSEFSTISGNPVQNKVITNKIIQIDASLNAIKNSEVWLTEDEWEELKKHPEQIDPNKKYYTYEEIS